MRNKGRALVALTACLAIVFLLIAWPKKEQKADESELSSLPILEVAAAPLPEEEIVTVEEVVEVIPISEGSLEPYSDESLLPPSVDRMAQLFQPYPPNLPIVETVEYKGRVDWLTGRTVYLGDYATHYKTSRHFISRSLHGMGNYLSDIVSTGDRFNVLRTDTEIEFHLVLDLARLKMWVYAYDTNEDQKILLKSYPVCAGRLSNNRLSGSLTPLGVYALGKDMGVYEEGMMSPFRGRERETITVFGKRWLPFGREIANCTAPSKGLGLHGVPWVRNGETGELFENRGCIGHFESEGCIRLLTEDIEELYSVIVSRPAYVHIVKDFVEAQVPGKEYR